MSTLKRFQTRTAENGLSVARKLLKYTTERNKKKFDKRAIKYLVKKLKEKLDELECLVTAVTTFGANPGKCVTLARTADGRLQVSGCVTYPHLIYARMWRWPDLKNHWRELKHISCCQFAYDLYCEVICVNPYHYERIVLPPINDDFSRFGINSKYRSKMFTNRGNTETTKFEHFGEHRHHHKLLPSSSRYTYSGNLVGPVQVFKNMSWNYDKRNNKKNWCSITYFEYADQISTRIRVPKIHRQMQIIGYTDFPDENFFVCLGRINNPKRSISSERARMSIGKGVQLEWRNGGDIWVRLLSKCQVFLQNTYLNLQSGYKPGQVTYRLCPSAVLKVFDLKQYHGNRQAIRDVVEKIICKVDETQTLSKESLDDQMLLQGLKQFCTLKMSFHKGWGPGYIRQNVQQTPCWVEIFFNEAYQLLHSTLFEEN